MNRSLRRVFGGQRNVSDTLEIRIVYTALLTKFDLC